MKSKFLSNLGLAMRAGKLVTGDEGVMAAVKSGDAKLVIIAEDAAANTSKKMSDKCSTYHVPVLVYGSREQLGMSIGKADRVVIAVTDKGFAQMLEKVWKLPEVQAIE